MGSIIFKNAGINIVALMQMMDVKNRERSEHSLMGEMLPKLPRLPGDTGRPENSRKEVYEDSCAESIIHTCILSLPLRKRGELTKRRTFNA